MNSWQDPDSAPQQIPTPCQRLKESMIYILLWFSKRANRASEMAYQIKAQTSKPDNMN